ncbi:HAD family hydrolase [Pseudanabaena sp. PCC 6802]|uniref:HAD family hydrolase n=1 Tax=Pseudanabaena sp. PCC 6802 TaxID=118173 RepID=UPI000346BBB8|nr:HAD family hydrolase [Pseudanabaena sp. PCC 6802]
MRKRLFTDFDGPIMDVSERYFQVYKFCLKQTKLAGQTVTPLSKREFWALKRAQVNEKDIALKSGLVEPGQAEQFAQLRRSTVHTDSYFKHDLIIEGAIAALEKAQDAGIELAVMTMRRERELLPVLHQYNLTRFFPSERRFYLSNDYVKTGDTKDKPKLMKRAIATLPKADRQWIVGDTEADIEAGKQHGVSTIGILSGIRNETQLRLQNPDAIEPHLIDAIELAIAS